MWATPKSSNNTCMISYSVWPAQKEASDGWTTCGTHSFVILKKNMWAVEQICGWFEVSPPAGQCLLSSSLYLQLSGLSGSWSFRAWIGMGSHMSSDSLIASQQNMQKNSIVWGRHFLSEEPLLFFFFLLFGKFPVFNFYLWLAVFSNQV